MMQPGARLESMTLRMLSLMLELAGGGRLTVLIFHRVLPAQDPLIPDIPDALQFERSMNLVTSYFNVLPMEEALERLGRRTLPRRAAVITFDDGYADNLTVAAPVLRHLGLSATFFIATGYLDGGRMWNDTVIEAMRSWSGDCLDLSALGLGVYPTGTWEERRAGVRGVIGRLKYQDSHKRSEACVALEEIVGQPLPRNLMMTSDQVRELERNGMTIGAHTVRHPILTRVTQSVAEEEINQSRDVLRELLGHEVKLFAYPNGKPVQDYDRIHVDIVRRAGFAGAVSTAPGVATADSDPFQVPRFTPWATEPARFLLQMAQNMLRTAPARVG